MVEMFPIIEVTSQMRSDVEQIGSKPKFWFKYEGRNWLFKEAREQTGEDWAEKIASEIASLMGLPTHHAELANWEGKRGCAVLSFLSSDQQTLIHGNEVLGGLITSYDKEKVHGQSDHTFDNIVAVLEVLFPESKARRVAAFIMVGYLVLDALVGNTDRHHQNWGVLMEWREIENQNPVFSVQLAPTFDHASSLGRELTDEARERYLTEGRLVSYIRKARGGIFQDATSRRGLSPMALAEMLAGRYPEFFKPWQKRLIELHDGTFEGLLKRIPDPRISKSGRAFALAFLGRSRRLLSEIL